LDQERVWGVHVDTAIFTNLTQDHLDYHGTMEAYARAKAKLFAGVGAAPPRVAVINADDPYAGYMQEAARNCQIRWTYGCDIPDGLPLPDFFADDYGITSTDTSIDWMTPKGMWELNSPLVGKVNVSNLLAASCAAVSRGLTPPEIVAAVWDLRQVPGRFESVSNSLGFTVVVDYAHTDDALRNLITLARELASTQTPPGKVITLFGCGGDRDKTKRPRMGRAAGEGSDLVLLTSDNPRTEDPDAILAQALVGVESTGATCIVEPDRRGAIEIAIRSASPNDIVLLAGKGHERIQILADGTIPFDDAAVAADVLAQLAEQHAPHRADEVTH